MLIKRYNIRIKYIIIFQIGCLFLYAPAALSVEPAEEIYRTSYKCQDQQVNHRWDASAEISIAPEYKGSRNILIEKGKGAYSGFKAV